MLRTVAMTHQDWCLCRAVALILTLAGLSPSSPLALADDTALDPGQIIERQLVGRVVDEQGKPLAGVEVFIPPAAGPLRGLPAPAPTVVTDAEGRFEAMVPSLRRLHLQYPYACPEGRVFQQKRVMKNGEGPLPELELVLPREVRLSGRVTDAAGVPVAGIEVSAAANGRGGGCVVDGAPPPCVHPEEHRSVSTDADGRYHFDRLMPGWVGVTVRSVGTTQWLRRRTTPGLELTDLDFVLPSVAVPLEGRVLGPGGEPLPDAVVSMFNGLDQLTQATDATGTFRFERVLSGSRFLAVSHPDHGWLEHGFELEPGMSVADGLELKMPRGALVRGRVVVPQGFELKDVRLWFEDGASSERRAWGGSPFVTPEPDGSFQLVVPVGEHVLGAQSSKDRTSFRWPLSVGVNDTFVDVELRLPSPSQVVGTVAGVSVKERVRVAIEMSSASRPAQAWSEDGRFKVDGVLPGRWLLTARDELGRTVERTVEVGEGEVLDLGEVRFPPLSGVRGRVGRPDGQSGVKAGLSFRQGVLHRREWTDDEGRFATQLSEGLWTAQASSEHAGLASLRFEITDRDVELPDLRLGPAPSLRVRFVGLPTGGLVSYLRVTSPDGEESHLKPSDDVTFFVAQVWPGEWTLETDVDGREVKRTVVIEVAARGSLEVELAVEE